MDKYEVIGKIGQGSFGTVCKIRRKQDGRILVWKELNYGIMNTREKKQLVAEVNILREFRHPHIVRYYDRVIDKPTTKIFIVMEFCEGGDIGQIIKQCRASRETIPEEFIWKIFTQMISALKECHRRDNKILHRDIKPRNIFLDRNKNVKLGDFGLARIMGENSVFAQTHVGTPYYMSPEQISGQAYNEKTDIWSAGCILYEIATLHPPFEARSHVELANKIKNGSIQPLPSRYSIELWTLIQRMLQKNPNQRPSVDELVQIQVGKQDVIRKEIEEPSVIERKGTAHFGGVEQVNLQDQRKEVKQDDQLERLRYREQQADLLEKQLTERKKRLEERERIILQRERVLQERPKDDYNRPHSRGNSIEGNRHNLVEEVTQYIMARKRRQY